MEDEKRWDTFLYHAIHGARLFKDLTPQQAKELVKDGWLDSPGKVSIIQEHKTKLDKEPKKPRSKK